MPSYTLISIAVNHVVIAPISITANNAILHSNFCKPCRPSSNMDYCKPCRNYTLKSISADHIVLVSYIDYYIDCCKSCRPALSPITVNHAALLSNIDNYKLSRSNIDKYKSYGTTLLSRLL